MALARFRQNLSLNKVGPQLVTVATAAGIGYIAGKRQVVKNETLPYIGPVPATALFGAAAMLGGIYMGGVAGDYISAAGVGALTIGGAEVGIRMGQESGKLDPNAKNKQALPPPDPTKKPAA